MLLKEQLKNFINESVLFYLMESQGQSIIDELNYVVHHYDSIIEERQEEVYEINEQLAKLNKELEMLVLQQNMPLELDQKMREFRALIEAQKAKVALTTKTIYDELIAVAERFKLPQIGRGSSRIVFGLPVGAYVLKLARNPKGIAQNEQEIKGYTNPSVKNIIPRIYPKSDLDNYMFMIVEKVVPMEVYKDFKEEKGYSFGIVADYVRSYRTQWKKYLVEDVVNYLSGKMGKDIMESDICTAEIPYYYRDLNFSGSNTIEDACHALNDESWLNDLGQLIESENLSQGDVAVDHFGKTTSGRLVIYDFGLSEDVFDKHYK